MLSTITISHQIILSAAPLVQELQRLSTIIAAVNAGTHTTQVFINEPSGVSTSLTTLLSATTLLPILTARQQVLQNQLTALGVSVT